MANVQPLPAPAPEISLSEVAAALCDAAPFMVLTGAGVSTGSGIPDYRDHAGAWKRRAPMQLSEFIGSELGRQRYWARSLVGWKTVESAQPNAAHHALAALEQRGQIQGLVTQNVDGLHQRAGSQQVVDLHGRLDRVECLDCGRVMPRQEHQMALEAANPDWAASVQKTGIAPDGDADLQAADYAEFCVPACSACGGLLKPAVVFFGENVPLERVTTVRQMLAQSGGLLVVGSSLMVWSGYRFVRAAAAAGKPVYILGLGVTRGDAEAQGRVTMECRAGLSALEQL